jgi:hypothetical protein
VTITPRSSAIQERDLEQHAAEGDRPSAPVRVLLLALQLVMDLTRGFGEEEEPSEDEDQVPPRDRIAEQGEERSRQAHDQRDGEEQEDPRSHRDEQPELTRASAVRLG